MNYNDDDRPGVRQTDSPTERLVPVVPDPLLLPTPEPLIAAEPPPIVPVTSEVTPDQIAFGPSWRNLVGASRASHAENAPNVPETPSFAQTTNAMANESTERTVANEIHHGDPVVPVSAVVTAEESVEAPLRREPTVTLSRVGEELFAWLKTLASAAVYATLIVTFGFQVARVEGQSMAPTLENQDRLIVNKLAYRLGQPRVGDIVMLYYPLNPEKSFVKRVIAEEGDQIRIVDGRVYRNDVPLNDDYVPPEYRSHDDWGPEVVPQGYYFVMGDHRNNSSDSRHWRFVPKKYIIGKVQLRWWPIPQAKIF